MKYFSILILALITIGATDMHGQSYVELNDIEIMNMGDGQMFAHRRDSVKTPLEGRLRLITGKSTEYTNAEFKDGFVTGKWERYEKNKLLISANYKDGYMDGEYIKLSSTGDILQIGSYIRGRREGTWEDFTSEGDKKSSTTYKGDEMTQKIEYYLDGNINWERNFKNGKEDGVKRRFDSEGKLQREEFYTNGRLTGRQYIHYTSSGQYGNFTKITHYDDRGRKNGEYMEEYSNGAILVKGAYRDNLKDGVWTYYYLDGTVSREQLYKKGEIIKDTARNL